MYKIYINDRPLTIAPLSEQLPSTKTHLSGVYLGNRRSLLHYIDALEKATVVESVGLHADNVDQLWNDLLGMYKVIEAAGGIVNNDQGDILAIFRRGNWDLPKGKIDPGETPEQAAVREVEEETGISDIELKSFIGATYHTYKNQKGKRVLKKSHWYAMTAPTQDLVPQVEEDIEQAIWVDGGDFLTHHHPMYTNIREIMRMVLEE